MGTSSYYSGDVVMACKYHTRFYRGCGGCTYYWNKQLGICVRCRNRQAVKGVKCPQCAQRDYATTKRREYGVRLSETQQYISNPTIEDVLATKSCEELGYV